MATVIGLDSRSWSGWIIKHVKFFNREFFCVISGNSMSFYKDDTLADLSSEVDLSQIYWACFLGHVRGVLR